MSFEAEFGRYTLAEPFAIYYAKMAGASFLDRGIRRETARISKLESRRRRTAPPGLQFKSLAILRKLLRFREASPQSAGAPGSPLFFAWQAPPGADSGV